MKFEKRLNFFTIASIIALALCIMSFVGNIGRVIEESKTNSSSNSSHSQTTGNSSNQQTGGSSTQCKTHTFGKYTVIQTATCEQEGIKVRTCKKCGYKERLTTVKTGHSYGEYVTVRYATCMINGLKQRSCRYCGKTETATIFANGKHSYGAYTITKAASCTYSGEQQRTCQVCNYTEKTILPKINHLTLSAGDYCSGCECQVFRNDGRIVLLKNKSNRLIEEIFSVESFNYNDFSDWKTAIVEVRFCSENVKNIPGNMFSGCTELPSITIPNSVTSIDSWAFNGCTGLIKVSLPSSIKSIGGHAFHGCTGLISISIPDGVTSIGDSAFRGCTGLSSITIPSSTTTIGNCVFSGCSGLTVLNVKSGNTKYRSAGNCLIETKSKTLILGCKNSVIPSDGSVISIGKYAFYNCTGLTSIVIPNNVMSIGESAFEECTDLTRISIPRSVMSIGRRAFCNCTKMTSIYFAGSQAEWNNILMGSNWNVSTGKYTIYYNSKM